jgi:hypothetical protein
VALPNNFQNFQKIHHLLVSQHQQKSVFQLCLSETKKQSKNLKSETIREIFSLFVVFYNHQKQKQIINNNCNKKNKEYQIKVCLKLIGAASATSSATRP